MRTYSTLSQFHAHPDEVLELSFFCAQKFGLNCYALIDHPFVPLRIESLDELEKAYSRNIKDYFQIVLVKEPINIVEYKNMEFIDKNPNSIIFEVGVLTKNTLGESCLSFRSNNEAAHKVSQQVARELKKITKAGVTGISARGDEAFYRSHRYTEKAKQLNIEGITPVPLGGTAIYRLY